MDINNVLSETADITAIASSFAYRDKQFLSFDVARRKKKNEKASIKTCKSWSRRVRREFAKTKGGFNVIN